jgi:hypothetical protein
MLSWDSTVMQFLRLILIMCLKSLNRLNLEVAGLVWCRNSGLQNRRTLMVWPPPVADDDGADDHEEDEGDLEMLVDKPRSFPRRRHKKKAPLDTSLLCYSARLEKINKDFNPSPGP